MLFYKWNVPVSIVTNVRMFWNVSVAMVTARTQGTGLLGNNMYARHWWIASVLLLCLQGNLCNMPSCKQSCSNVSISPTNGPDVRLCGHAHGPGVRALKYSAGAPGLCCHAHFHVHTLTNIRTPGFRMNVQILATRGTNIWTFEHSSQP